VATASIFRVVVRRGVGKWVSIYTTLLAKLLKRRFSYRHSGAPREPPGHRKDPEPSEV
jgi:hypothetical protein